jgi:hypothetical protein
MVYFYSKDLIIEEINKENVFIPHIAEKRWTLNTFQFYIILILNMDFTKSKINSAKNDPTITSRSKKRSNCKIEVTKCNSIDYFNSH